MDECPSVILKEVTQTRKDKYCISSAYTDPSFGLIYNFMIIGHITRKGTRWEEEEEEEEQQPPICFKKVHSILLHTCLWPAVIVTFSAGRGTEDTLEAVKILVSESWKERNQLLLVSEICHRSGKLSTKREGKLYEKTKNYPEEYWIHWCQVCLMVLPKQGMVWRNTIKHNRAILYTDWTHRRLSLC